MPGPAEPGRHIESDLAIPKSENTLRERHRLNGIVRDEDRREKMLPPNALAASSPTGAIP